MSKTDEVWLFHVLSAGIFSLWDPPCERWFAGRVPRPSPTWVGSYKKSHPLDSVQNPEIAPSEHGLTGLFWLKLTRKALYSLESYKSKFQT